MSVEANSLHCTAHSRHHRLLPSAQSDFDELVANGLDSLEQGVSDFSSSIEPSWMKRYHAQQTSKTLVKINTLDSRWHVPGSEVKIFGAESLGKGATGEVFKATLSCGEAVAAKKIRSDAHRSSFARRFQVMHDMQHEILVATKLPSHPNISGFRGYAHTENEEICIFWELINGEDLERLYLRKRRENQCIWRPQTLTVLNWCHQIFSALACLHENHLAHRDVKPANIMVTNDLETIKLIDYGLCTEIRGGETACPGMTGKTGSFRYMAPEVFLESDYGSKVDTYSAAICAWFIAAGEAPFGSLDGLVVAEMAARTHLRPLLKGKGFQNPRLRSLITSAWASNQADRPTARMCERELALLVSGERKTADRWLPFGRLPSVIKQNLKGSSRTPS